jgi:hypothetical protein
MRQKERKRERDGERLDKIGSSETRQPEPHLPKESSKSVYSKCLKVRVAWRFLAFSFFHNF